MTIYSELVTYIAKASKIPPGELNETTEIYNSGIISSLTLLELMAFIENRFNVLINPEDLIEDNFKDLKTLVGFIEKIIPREGATHV